MCHLRPEIRASQASTKSGQVHRPLARQLTAHKARGFQELRTCPPLSRAYACTPLAGVHTCRAPYCPRSSSAVTNASWARRSGADLPTTGVDDAYASTDLTHGYPFSRLPSAQLSRRDAALHSGQRTCGTTIGVRGRPRVPRQYRACIGAVARSKDLSGRCRGCVVARSDPSNHRWPRTHGAHVRAGATGRSADGAAPSVRGARLLLGHDG